ncbi:hypothetical protein D3C83_255080 [compost metagenome]
MANFFKDSDCIGFFFWVLPQFHQLIEQLIHVGEVEISSEDQVPGDPIIEADKRMAGFNGIITMGPISEVSH